MDKIKNFLKKIIRKENRNPIMNFPLPRYIRVETTNLCNLRCQMCFHSTETVSDLKTLKKGFMRPALFKKIITELAKYPQLKKSMLALHIGGEPLLHKNIVDFIKFCARKGLKPNLTTNGMLLDRKIAQLLIGSGLHEIHFSFEGIDKKIYESFRIGSNFEQVKKNIQYFLDLNAKNGHKIKTGLVVVNLPQIPQKAKQAFIKKMKNKFDLVILSGYFDWLGKIDKKVSHNKTMANYQVCPAPDTDLNVLFDGTVVPCCMDVYGEMPIGDFDKMTLEEVLTSSARKKLKKKLVNTDIDDLPCKNCVVPWNSRK